jgi:hypothetical protein
VYFDGRDHINSDVANAVCDGLVAKLVQREEPNDLTARWLERPYFEVHYDFILVPRTLGSFDGNLQIEMQVSALQPESLT